MIEAPPDKPVEPLLFLCKYENAVLPTFNNGKKQPPKIRRFLQWLFATFVPP